MASIALYSSKGGVGKSSVAIGLAHLAATRSGRRTLLWDLDAQGAATHMLGGVSARPRARKLFAGDLAIGEATAPTCFPGLSLLSADASLRQLDVQLIEADRKKRLRKLIQSLQPDYDRIVLDCPPGITELSEQVFRAVDLVVVPVVPSPLAMRAYEEVAAHVAREFRGKTPLLPFFTMVDRRRSLHRAMLSTNPDWPMVPYASAVEQMALRRRPVTDFAPSSPAAQGISALWQAIERRLVKS